MDIISIVNDLQPGTIQRLALNATDFHGDSSIPFMGVFVQLFPGATLPDPAAVTAHEPTYTATLAAAQAAAVAAAQAADPAVQIANLTAYVLNGTPLPDAMVTAVNAKLTSLGQVEISAVAATPLKLG